MQQPDSLPSDESIIVVHTAQSGTEALVVRALLEGAGIASPEIGVGSPSPWPGLVSILHPAQRIEIYALESQAGRARQLIADYLAEREQGTECAAEQIDSDDGAEI